MSDDPNSDSIKTQEPTRYYSDAMTTPTTTGTTPTTPTQSQPTATAAAVLLNNSASRSVAGSSTSSQPMLGPVMGSQRSSTDQLSKSAGNTSQTFGPNFIELESKHASSQLSLLREDATSSTSGTKLVAMLPRASMEDVHSEMQSPSNVNTPTMPRMMLPTIEDRLSVIEQQQTHILGKLSSIERLVSLSANYSNNTPQHYYHNAHNADSLVSTASNFYDVKSTTPMSTVKMSIARMRGLVSTRRNINNVGGDATSGSFNDFSREGSNLSGVRKRVSVHFREPCAQSSSTAAITAATSTGDFSNIQQENPLSPSSAQSSLPQMPTSPLNNINNPNNQSSTSASSSYRASPATNNQPNNSNTNDYMKKIPPPPPGFALTYRKELCSTDGIFLPEHPLVTCCDVLFWLLAVYELIFCINFIGNYNWSKSPRSEEIALLAVSSVVMLGFIAMRSRVARAVGWELVEKPQSVLRLYIRTWLFFDLLTGLPFDLIVLPFSTIAFRVITTLRMLHFVRIPALFQASNPLIPSRTIRVGILLLSFIVWFHCLAGMLWMLLNSTKYPTSQLSDYEISLKGVYWAIQTSTSVGYGDILPDDTDWQNRLLYMLVMLVGVGGYSYFISTMSVAVIRMDSVQHALREKKQKLNSMMNFYDVPWELQKQAFSVYPRLLETSKRDYADVMCDLPGFMQEQMNTYMKVKLLSVVPMFQRAEPEVVWHLCHHLSEAFVAPGEYVVQIGDLGNEMYFLAHGVVEVLLAGSNGGGEIQIAMLKDGSFFGEIALLKETTRTASIRTVTACDLMVLLKEDFEAILESFPTSNFSRLIAAEVKKRFGDTMNNNNNSNSNKGGDVDGDTHEGGGENGGSAVEFDHQHHHFEDDDDGFEPIAGEYINLGCNVDDVKSVCSKAGITNFNDDSK
eukprot:PhM_4_TR7153/c0_g1_i1/m.50657/K04955/HCN2; hyperpolarization activated cyclic nucleotide-gated potassium channel 2